MNILKKRGAFVRPFSLLSLRTDAACLCWHPISMLLFHLVFEEAFKNFSNRKRKFVCRCYSVFFQSSLFWEKDKHILRKQGNQQQKTVTDVHLLKWSGKTWPGMMTVGLYSQRDIPYGLRHKDVPQYRIDFKTWKYMNHVFHTPNMK